MKVSEAIKEADALRPNTVDDEQKVKWLQELEGEIAEMLGVECPTIQFPVENQSLLLPDHEEVYPRYLIAMIDYYNGESALYENDITLFNRIYAEAKAFYRRHHVPKQEKDWRTL